MTVASVELKLIATGLTSPVDLVDPNDGTGRLLIVDQIGVVRVVDASGTLLETPFLDLQSRLIELSPTYDERGLLGLAMHPDFAANGRFFVVYSAPLGDGAPTGYDSELRLAEFHVDPPDADAADLTSEETLLSIPKPQANHNGGQIAFGPDGLLYLSVGDGGGANDEGLGHTSGTGNAQDLSNLMGKILRLDVDSDAEEPYVVPPDNPFVGDENARPEVWAYGLRNPWRFSFDPGGDERLFVADAGQDLFEEVDIVVRGGNYGWRIREGEACFDPDDAGDPPAECPTVGADGEPLIGPILQFGHTDERGIPTGTVVIGGYVYRGTSLPALQGQYVFGDFTVLSAVPEGRLYAAGEDDNGNWTLGSLNVANRSSGEIDRYVLAFGQDSAGEIYVLTSGHLGPTGTAGEVYRLEADE